MPAGCDLAHTFPVTLLPSSQVAAGLIPDPGPAAYLRTGGGVAPHAVHAPVQPLQQPLHVRGL
jgi:hypothetical protein